MRRLAGGLRQAGRHTLDVLLPPRCLTCDTPVLLQGTLCGACFGQLHFIVDPTCDQCGVPFTAGENRVCAVCAANPPAFAQARGALRYDSGARRLLLPFKHADRTELATVLAQQMARTGAALLDRADLLVPVPLHWTRMLRRRYNQAALLARALGRLRGKPAVLDALVRRRATAALGDKTAPERAAAVAAAVAIRRPRAIAGRRVLLIDDVMTSGATANVCAAALLDAGASAVDVLVAARVPDPRAVD